MKKLLSLLSVLIISGIAVPTTIAASLYQKEKTINNNNLQTNNSEKLNRIKRNDKDAKKIVVILNKIVLKFSGGNDFIRSLENILTTLQSENILITRSSNLNNIPILGINDRVNDNSIFIVTVDLDDSSAGSSIELVFSAQDFYIVGFVIRNNNTDTCYYFNERFSSINNDNLSRIYLNVPVNYNNLRKSKTISGETIISSLCALLNFQGKDTQKIMKNLANIALLAESLRFQTIENYIKNMLDNWQEYSWSQDISPIILNWQTDSIESLALWNIFPNQSENNLVSEFIIRRDQIPNHRTPHVFNICVMEELEINPNLEIGSIIMQRHIPNGINLETENIVCSSTKKNKRDIDQLIKQSGKVCWIGYNGLDKDAYLLPNIPDIVTSTVLLHQDIVGELKTNAAYFGTTNGVYYRKGNGTDEVKKVSGLNEPIKYIKIDKDGSAWALTEIKIRKQKSPGWFSNENNNLKNEDSGTCLVINNKNPYFDENKDKTIWISNFPANLVSHAAGIRTFLSLKTAKVIEKILFERDEENFKSYLVNLFKKIPNENSESDFPKLVNAIFQGFSQFHIKVIELEKINDMSKRIVVDITNGFSYFYFSTSSKTICINDITMSTSTDCS